MKSIRFHNYFIIYNQSMRPRKTTLSFLRKKFIKKNFLNLIFRASSFMLSVIPYSRGLSSVWRSTSSPQSSMSWPIISSTSSPSICYHWSSSPRLTPSSFTRFRKQREGTKVQLKVVYIYLLCWHSVFFNLSFFYCILNKNKDTLKH